MFTLYLELIYKLSSSLSYFDTILKTINTNTNTRISRFVIKYHYNKFKYFT